MMESIRKLRALGIVGSPRMNGNTQALVNAALEGARSVGAETDTVSLARLNISPCTACGGCAETARCVIQDDMHRVFDLMWRSDLWVLGTPVYWWGPSAQFKAFLDRWQAPAATKTSAARFSGQRVLLVVPMGGEDESYGRHVVGMLSDIFDYMGMQTVDIVSAPGVFGADDLRAHPQYLDRARRAGRRGVTLP